MNQEIPSIDIDVFSMRIRFWTWWNQTKLSLLFVLSRTELVLLFMVWWRTPLHLSFVWSSPFLNQDFGHFKCRFSKISATNVMVGWEWTLWWSCEAGRLWWSCQDRGCSGPVRREGVVFLLGMEGVVVLSGWRVWWSFKDRECGGPVRLGGYGGPVRLESVVVL